MAKTEMRAFSPSFSPFTHTTVAGNGIANPSTLHASWQLVISRPVLRQHTPRYVSHPRRVVVLVAPPSTQKYPLDLAFLPLPARAPFIPLPFSLFRFPSFSLTISRVSVPHLPPHFTLIATSFSSNFLLSSRTTSFVLLPRPDLLHFYSVT